MNLKMKMLVAFFPNNRWWRWQYFPTEGPQKLASSKLFLLFL